MIKRQKMYNFRINLYNIIVAGLVLGLIIATIKCEDNIFRIRKCCAENEVLSERVSLCIENKLYTQKNNIYFHINETELGDDSDPKNSRPLWFPSESKIISKQTNETLKTFPEKHQLIMGEELPCNEDLTSTVPAFYYNFSFYDDGSIILHPVADSYPFEDKVFEPLSFCVDGLDINDMDYTSGELEETLDIPTSEAYVVRLCPCAKSTCILKCCHPGMLYDIRFGENDDSCVKNTGADWKPIYTKLDGRDSDYYILNGWPACKPGEGVVLPNYENLNVSDYVIFSNGSARLYGEDLIIEPLQFCGEYMIDNVDNKTYNRILRCVPFTGVEGNWVKEKKIIYGWMSVAGAFFLWLTLIIHYSLPAVRKLHDQSLIYQTWSLFIGYIALAVVELRNQNFQEGICSFLAFLIQYCFLAAFFWLNVLCFDISYTFSSLRISHGCHGQHMKKKNIFYLTYGWFTPGFIVLVTVLMMYYPGGSDHVLKPAIDDRCFFKKGSLPELAYFHGPIAILLAINVFLFLYTTYKIIQARSDISTTIRSKNVENRRFLLYLKLFILMGLSWTTEFIAWAIEAPSYYWFIPDTVTLLRAVFIFVIMCCKKKVYEELKKRIFCKMGGNVRRPSNTRSSSVPGLQQFSEQYKSPNNADSIL